MSSIPHDRLPPARSPGASPAGANPVPATNDSASVRDTYEAPTQPTLNRAPALEKAPNPYAPIRAAASHRLHESWNWASRAEAAADIFLVSGLGLLGLGMLWPPAAIMWGFAGLALLVGGALQLASRWLRAAQESRYNEAKRTDRLDQAHTLEAVHTGIEQINCRLTALEAALTPPRSSWNPTAWFRSGSPEPAGRGGRAANP